MAGGKKGGKKKKKDDDEDRGEVPDVGGRPLEELWGHGVQIERGVLSDGEARGSGDAVVLLSRKAMQRMGIREDACVGVGLLVGKRVNEIVTMTGEDGGEVSVVPPLERGEVCQVRRIDVGEGETGAGTTRFEGAYVLPALARGHSALTDGEVIVLGSLRSALRSAGGRTGSLVAVRAYGDVVDTGEKGLGNEGGDFCPPLCSRVQLKAPVGREEENPLSLLLAPRPDLAVQILEAATLRTLKGKMVIQGNPVSVDMLGSRRSFVINMLELPNGGGPGKGPARIEKTTIVEFCFPEGTQSAMRRLVRLAESSEGTSTQNSPSFSHPLKSASRGSKKSKSAEKGKGSSGGARKAPGLTGKTIGERALESGMRLKSSWKQNGSQTLRGVSKIYDELQSAVVIPLRSLDTFRQLDIRPPRGVLLHGPPGTGKTTLAQAVACEADLNLLVLHGPDVMGENMGESEKRLRNVFEVAAQNVPAVVFIDEIDALAPAKGDSDGAEDAMVSRVVSTLLALFDGDGLENGGAGIAVIAATNRVGALDPSIRGSGRFDYEIEVPPPTPTARLEILASCVEPLPHTLTKAAVVDLSERMHGYTCADIKAFVSESSTFAMRRLVAVCENRGMSASDIVSAGMCVMTDHDFENALRVVRPSAMREVYVEVPKTNWEDVGGLEEVKQRIREAVEWPRTRAEDLARLGVVAPSGTLLYGPPGCSKTMIARAVACETGLNFIPVKGPELVSMYVGESEKAVASLFQRARLVAPSVIFLDEIDGLVGSRGETGSTGTSAGDGTGVGNRLLAQLLGEMDGIQPLNDVVIIGATNRPDLIDPALLRPGRFDRLIYVPPPDVSGREAVLRVHTREIPLSSDVDIAAIASEELTHLFTGADLAAVCRKAGMNALDESLEATEVCARHFESAVKATRRTITPEMLKFYDDFQRG